MRKRIFVFLCILFWAFSSLSLPVNAASSAETILNEAELNPDYFLAKGSDEYDSELEFGRHRIEGFLPEDADELLKKTISEQTSDTMSTYQKVKSLYTYIIEITDYKGACGGTYGSVHAVLVDHIGDCMDYNYVMMAFLRYLGIESALVRGKTGSEAAGYVRHFWAEAYIGGNTYIFDPEVDDKISNGGPIYYYRFCRTYSELSSYYILEDANYYKTREEDLSGALFYVAFSGANTATVYSFNPATLRKIAEHLKMDTSSLSFYYDSQCTMPVDIDVLIRENTSIWVVAKESNDLGQNDVNSVISVTVHGVHIQWTDVVPFIDSNNRTMVPLRAVGEALGLGVEWDGNERMAIFTNGSKEIRFPVGSKVALTGEGSEIEMDTATVIINNRTYAPIRFLAEYFGYEVQWNSATRTVIIQ